MHVDQLFPSRFFRAADLGGKPLRVTIASVQREDVGGESKVILSFSDNDKSLIANKTNCRAIGRLLGNETNLWRGKAITLVPALVDFKGESVDAIRVRPATSRKSAGNDEPAFDDELDN
jgi:hypothetical protein